MATETTTPGLDPSWSEDFAARWRAAWWGRERCALLELMTDDIVYDDSAWPRTMHGHGDVREFLDHAWRAIPDLTFERLAGPLLAADAPTAAFYWRGTGTFSGPMEPPGFAPTGQRLDFNGFDLHEYRDGRVSRLVIVFDNGVVGRQIGALPQPGSRAEKLGVQLQRLAARRLRRSA